MSFCLKSLFNLLQHCLCFYFFIFIFILFLFFFGCKWHGSLRPQPGIKLALESEVLTSRPPGKSLFFVSLNFLWLPALLVWLPHHTSPSLHGHITFCSLLCIKSPSCCCCCSVLSCVQFFMTPWTVTHQASLPLWSPRFCSNPCPLSPWCYPIMSSSTTLFFFCFQFSPASRGKLGSSHQVTKVLEL